MWAELNGPRECIGQTDQEKMMGNGNSSNLVSIRLGTEDDLADATALASRVLAKAPSNLDPVSLQFSHDLFVAVSLYIAYTEKNGTLTDMLDFLVDPSWDCARQVFCYFQHADQAFQQSNAAIWRKGFLKKIARLTDESAAESLLTRCHLHWKKAVIAIGGVTKRKAIPRASMPVFNQEAVAKAVEMVSGLKEDKKAGIDRILQNAQVNDGYRAVPDAKMSCIKLEGAKSRFENLVEPISRLQIDLVLASAMKPEEFRITPILLLGDPGIGKTYLATQLAGALGVPMEKISAGGAQGGFQLNGSHTSWQGARPGSLFTLLAEGKSASPVVVIDEVDKIGDSNYPVLAVLLDLLEPHTAKEFKDQFFEMAFDASRMIFVLTANSLDGVPAALLSRVEVFDVPRPEPVQRLRIIEELVKQLCLKTKKQITLDNSTSQSLAERMDIDLRRLSRLVKEAFARAMQSGETLVSVQVPAFSGKRTIGFSAYRV